MPSRYQHGPPYPFHCQIAGLGLMLETGLQGVAGWHEEKVRYFDQVQLTADDRDYAQFPPEVEFPYAVTELWGGMGIAEQKRDDRTRYHFALFADCSAGRPIKGPKFNSQTALLAPITNTVEYNGKLYAAAGRYLYKRNDDTAGGWAQVKDYGAGVTIGQLATFQGTQTSSFLFVPLGSGQVYEAMSTAETFTAHASQTAEGFEVIADELWLYTTASGRRQIKKSDDGGTAATWGAATFIGDASHKITWARSVGRRLLLAKENGLFGPSPESPNIDDELAQGLRPLAATDNGAGSIAWNETLVARYGGGLYRYDPNTGGTQQFGPETLEENASEVKGDLKGFAGQAGLALWAGLYNTSNGHSYLLRFGGWRTLATPQGPSRQFVPAWHGALFKWTTKQIASMHVSSVVAGKPRLYVFFADGGVEWCKLARTASPLDDPDYEFDTANTGSVHYPRYTANFPFEDKLIKAVGLAGRNLLSGTKTLGVEWKYATDSTYVAVGTTGLDPGERLTLNTQPSARAIDFRATLATTSPSQTPVLSAFVVYALIRTENLKRVVARIKCGDKVPDRQGRPMRRSWRDIRLHIEDTVAAVGTVTIVNPAGETATVIGVNFGHTLLGYEADQAPVWHETIEMIQTKSQAIRGTWDRAAAYTWGDLAAFTWQQVSVI